MATPKNWTPDPGNEEKPVIKAWRNTETGTNVFISETAEAVRKRSGYRYTVELVGAQRGTAPIETLNPFRNKKKARKYVVQWMKNHPRT